MKLYTVTICGCKYYFTGDLTPDDVKSAEKLCAEIKADTTYPDSHHLFMLLINHLNSNTHSTVAPINIEHIFRINF